MCNYIYNYTVDPALNRPIPPNLSLTVLISHLNREMQYEHNTYIVLTSKNKYIVVNGT